MEACQFPTANKNPSVQMKNPNNIADFFHIRGIVHYELLPIGQTVNQVYYFEVLEKLLENVRRKRPETFANNSSILHHENATAHMAISVMEVLARSY